MIEVRHYAAGRQVDPIGERPNEPFPLLISMDWLEQKAEARIDLTSLSFEGQDGLLIKQRAFSGRSGGLGVFEGMPYSVQVGSVSDFETFDMYIDFTKELSFFGECGVNVTVQQKQGANWLNDVADGIPFAYLYEIGVITDSDFYSVPYVINYIPDGTQLLILALSTYSLTKELIEGIKAVADRIADLTDASTPVLGISVGVGAGAVTAWDIGNIILAALKLVAQIAYTIAIVVALVKLTEQVVEQIMPPKRFHQGIGLKVLLERFCQHLGLTLQSSLMDSLDKSGNKWVYQPPKNHRGGEKPTAAGSTWKETAIPPVDSPIYTGGGLIRELKKMLNADFKIRDGVFYFERVDDFEVTNPYVIPSTFIDQDKIQNVYSINTGEIWSNYNISWSTDVQDQNTLDNIEGLSFQAQTVPNRTSDPRLTNIQGAEIIALPFSLAVRKNELTAIEKAVKDLVSLLDFVTGQLGQPQSLGSRINNRIGAMHQSSHFTSIGKVIVMAGRNLQEGQRKITGATALWDNYHYVNTFASYQEEHSQYYLYQGQEVPFCFEDYKKIKTSNRVVTEEGKKAEIESLTWDVVGNTATINYRVKEIYDNNLKTIIL